MPRIFGPCESVCYINSLCPHGPNIELMWIRWLHDVVSTMASLWLPTTMHSTMPSNGFHDRFHKSFHKGFHKGLHNGLQSLPQWLPRKRVLKPLASLTKPMASFTKAFLKPLYICIYIYVSSRQWLPWNHCMYTRIHEYMSCQQWLTWQRVDNGFLVYLRFFVWIFGEMLVKSILVV